MSKYKMTFIYTVIKIVKNTKYATLNLSTDC